MTNLYRLSIHRSVSFLRNQTNYHLISDYNHRFGEPDQFDINSFYSYYTNFDINFYKNKYNLQNKSEIEILNHYHNIGIKNKLLYNNKIKIVIYTPPLDDLCGGVQVLHNLAKSINDLNHPEIYALLCTYDHSRYQNNFCNSFVNPHQVDDHTVVIYPEVITGNPLNAKHVIRWVLLDLGFETQTNHYEHWDSNDIVYHWEPHPHKHSKQLVNLWINPKITALLNENINYETKRRELTNCFLFKKVIFCPGKFHKNIKYMHNNFDISLDNKNIDDIINIMKISNKFYCYDPNTFYSILAPLLGCITVLHPIEGKSKKEYFESRINAKNNFTFDYGIAYGDSDEEINRAHETVQLAKDKFNKWILLYKNDTLSLLNDIFKLINNEKLNNTVEAIYINQS
jgi:hypothetical protein